MAWFVYITTECETAARRHSVETKMQQFKNEVEDKQALSITRFCQFPQPYLVKKKFAGWEGRLIAQRRDFKLGEEEHTVIVFLDYMTRGDSGYDKKTGFGHDPVSYGRTHYEGRVSLDSLKSYVKERLKTTPVEENPPPSEFEWGYLTAATQHVDWGEEYVYESQEWSEAVNQESLQFKRSNIFDALGNFSSENQRCIISVSGIQLLIYNFSECHIIFLAAAGKPEVIEKNANKYDALLKNPTRELISKYACHAYPRLVLGADFDFWSNIESSKAGNIALSPEESQLLEDTRKNSQKSFPLFINGRAGSGKSTILQFLFADYLAYYLKNQQGKPPST